MIKFYIRFSYHKKNKLGDNYLCNIFKCAFDVRVQSNILSISILKQYIVIK
jgi:hypothetical protein